MVVDFTGLRECSNVCIWPLADIVSARKSVRLQG